jgi:hypothetical protein
LTGKGGSDTFVLGRETTPFYVGGGDQDYALIKNFNQNQGDIIQLTGNANDYFLGSASAGQTTGTGVFLASDPSELIGIIEGIQPKTLSLSQPVFQYV